MGLFTIGSDNETKEFWVLGEKRRTSLKKKSCIIKTMVYLSATRRLPKTAVSRNFDLISIQEPLTTICVFIWLAFWLKFSTSEALFDVVNIYYESAYIVLYFLTQVCLVVSVSFAPSKTA